MMASYPAPANGVAVPARATATVGTAPLADVTENYSTAAPLAAEPLFVSGGVAILGRTIPAWAIVLGAIVLYLWGKGR